MTPHIPASIRSTRLWAQVALDDDLTHQIRQLRSNASAIGAKVAEAIPGFTDHSLKHMDALWAIADVVFTPDEIALFTPGEAFVLGCAFYLHDLGMAAAATPEGRQSLEATSSYRNCYARLSSTAGLEPSVVRQIALQVCARESHAERAEGLVDTIVPGLDRYLLESKETRDHWGDHIGKVAASHHWGLRDVDSRMGSAGRVPGPKGHALDLAVVACALRIIDYAHINSDRASQLERLLRADMAEDSLVHWLAQEFITGPTREGNQLVYASMRPLANVDAWWVFYEMATGLDREITEVGDYLSSRTVSADRFSLEGVKGVKTPNAFAKLVRPGEFAPVDIRFRPDSMTRLVDLLGGKQLYGNDRFAPLRELLQNARDAVHLQRALDTASGQPPRVGQIDVKLVEGDKSTVLSVSDDGVGMSAKTVSTYLLGIASDFWRSTDFFGEFPGVAAGFNPVGRFGIGFLSVFMLGDDVEVDTQRLSGANLRLRLRGVGKRGSLQERPSALRHGTTVRVGIAPERQGDLAGLARIVQAKAPMLDVRITVTERGAPVHIEPDWWQQVSQEDLSEFLFHRELTAIMPMREQRRRAAAAKRIWERQYLQNRMVLRDIPPAHKWPGTQPESTTKAFRVIATPTGGRVLLCSKGFAIADVAMAGLSGMAEVGDVELNAARSLPIGFDEEGFRQELLRSLRPQIIAATDSLADEGAVPVRFSFLNTLAGSYGRQLLAEINLPWIGRQQPPGNTSLLNAADVRTLLSSASQVFIAYNCGPWVADTSVRSFHPDVNVQHLVLVVPRGGGPDIRTQYGREKGRVDGPLSDHFVPDHVGEGSGESRLEEAHLLLALLDCVAAAWNVSADSLRADGWSRGNGTLIGRLGRATVV